MQPLEPNEEQILAKFAGFEDSPDRFLKGKLELNVLVVRIQKARGPITGEQPAEDEEDTDAEAKSIKDMTKERLNSATTLVDFLKRRSIKSSLSPLKLKRSPKCRLGSSAGTGVCTIADHAAWNAETTQPFGLKSVGALLSASSMSPAQVSAAAGSRSARPDRTSTSPDTTA